MRLLTSFLFVLAWASTVYPQSTAAAAPPVSSVAYETLELPKDRVAAWDMLRAAQGLGDETLQPWALQVHYKTYDAFGKAKGTGTMQYVWAGPHHWHIQFNEDGVNWAKWETDKGTYTPKGQIQPSPGYPASLILNHYIHPLARQNGSNETPAYYGKYFIGGSSFTCFSNKPLSQITPYGDSGELDRICTVLNKPFLVLVQGDYDVLYQKLAVFQHRIVAEHIVINDRPDKLVEADADSLTAASNQQLSSLTPPADSSFTAISSSHGEHVEAGGLIKNVTPIYPEAAKQKRIQGTVRLAGKIGVDGHLTLTGVLHSPDPVLTEAAEQAVRQWTYAPYLLDGKPVEVETVVQVSYYLSR